MRDFLNFVRRPSDLLKALRRITVGGVIATTGASVAPPTAAAAELPGSTEVDSLTPTIVDGSRKAAKVLLQIPGSTALVRAEHRSHRSHSSHRSHYSGSGGVSAPQPTPAPTPAPRTASPAPLAESTVSSAELVGTEFMPKGNVDLYDSIGVTTYKRITPEQISKESLMFVIRNVMASNGKTYYRVAVRSWALGGGDRMVGWIEAPASGAQPGDRRPASSVNAPTPTLDLTAPTGADSVIGDIVSIDTDARTITIRQGTNGRREFAYRDDSKFEGMLGIPVRFDDFADSNGGRLPVTARDKVQITWRTSPDGKTSILSTIKKTQ